MKQIISAILLVIATVSLVVFSFTYWQVEQEEKELTDDLQYRSTLLADNIKTSVEPIVVSKSNEQLQTYIEQYSENERVNGLIIYDNKDTILAKTATMSADFVKAQSVAQAAMDENRVNGELYITEGRRQYLFAVPLRDQERVVGSLLIVQNAAYIDSDLQEIWQRNLIRLLIQSILLSIAIVFILNWLVYRPLQNLLKVIRSAREGDVLNKEQYLRGHSFFKPILREVLSLHQSLTETKLKASKQAKLLFEKYDAPWTVERLKEFTKNIIKGRTIIIVSNREPYIHKRQGNKIIYMEPASGMVTALEALMRACGGMWVAHGSGDADKEVVDSADKIAVPPGDPKYTLKRVWLTPEEEKGHYYGFSNEGLWPLCHTVHTRPIFRKEDWEMYQQVNGKFAETILSEIKNIKNPIIFIQDFHLACLPKIIKHSRPDAVIGIFWHVPWPSSESFRICPWRKELLEGMLGADLIAFHTQQHCNNFIETVGRELEALVDLEQFTIQKEGHISYVKPVPISVPFEGMSNLAVDEIAWQNERAELLKKLGIKTKFIGVGVDRMDYTKGIIERMKAIEYFLQTHNSYRERFTFIQVAPPSRATIPAYKRFTEEVDEVVEKINTRFQTNGWKPIVLLKKHHSHEEVNQLYRIADIALVTSLHDGMNLVAKEFIVARDDEKGVLILSQFAGASRQLKNALIVNPYHIEQVGETIFQGLEMMPSEQMKRMKSLREEVKSYNVYRWSAELLKTMIQIQP
jgi:alpha,alpha-trehalose-phosphate synthase [UDP-forming]